MGRWQERTVEKPRIVVYAAPEAAEFPLREVQLGLEEEGIPSQLERKTGKNAIDLAWEAAAHSPLGTGVGAGEDGLAVHYHRLKKDTPLFFIRQDELNSEESRRIGVNAARLVKGVPFREKGIQPASSEKELAADIASAVIEVLQQLAKKGKEGDIYDE